MRFADVTAIIAKTQGELQDLKKQIGWHWKEVWHGNQHRQITSILMRVSRSYESLRIEVRIWEIKVGDFKYLGSVNKRWLLYKGNQDENCLGQRSI